VESGCELFEVMLFFAVCILLPCGGCCYLGFFLGRLVGYQLKKLKLKNMFLLF